jgi:hypothetical protein
VQGIHEKKLTDPLPMKTPIHRKPAQ